LQLRYLQTLREIGGGQNSTIVFPVDVVRPLVQALGGAAAPSGEAQAAEAQPSGTAALDAMVAESLEAARRGQLGPGTESTANGAADAEPERQPARATDDDESAGT
jgi:hypothetical protein